MPQEEYSDSQILSGLKQLDSMLSGGRVVAAAIRRFQEVQKELKRFDEEKAVKLKEIGELDAKKASHTEQERGAWKKFKQIEQDIDVSLKAKRKELSDLAAEAESRRQAIATLNSEYAEKRAALEAKIKADLAKEQSTLDAIRAEVDKFKKQFAA